ncbi:MAG: peptide ABC transporter substrate-binding protein [Candidatus Niyogibacteria bacterium]|nr:peptide ABC transporter substrate-binding protein [Candidatus Niyogibacteria bacterium]
MIKSSFPFVKRSSIPTLLELRVVLRGLVAWEKIAFLIATGAIVIGTLGFWIQLQKRFAVMIPAPGGSFVEGITGTPHLANPLLASTEADRDLTNLLYAGLMKSDGTGGLETNLAQNYTISEDGLVYEFTLRGGLTWHDGEPITADDVAFTIQAAKNPAIKSPLRANWEGVDIEVVNDHQIRFVLKRPYSPFLENMTVGILPRHIWKNATSDQFSLSEYNRKVIGAGPYEVDAIERNAAGIITAYELGAFEHYALGKPLIRKITLRFYNSEAEALSALRGGAIDALSSLSADKTAELQNFGDRLRLLSLPRIFGVFFNQNKSAALQDRAVRLALVQSIDKKEIIETALGGFGIAIDDPIPPEILHRGSPTDRFDLLNASSTLAKAGWKLNPTTGIREKAEGKKPAIPLAFTISTANTPELAAAAEIVRNQWRAIGANVEVRTFEIGDLNQNIIRPREYEALLFGEVVGRDPDPFAFWHSSQRNDPGLNIALYTNKTTDKLVEEARTTHDAVLRREKYAAFLDEVRKDAPAAFLYSPSYVYVAAPGLRGFDTRLITVPAERFANVHAWHLYTTRVWKIFLK